MIPKLDTYMYKTLKRYIRAILTTAGTEDEPYVLGAVLGDKAASIASSNSPPRKIPFACW